MTCYVENHINNGMAANLLKFNSGINNTIIEFLGMCKQNVLSQLLLAVICCLFFVSANIVRVHFGGDAEYSIMPYLDIAMTVVAPSVFAVSLVLYLAYLIFVLRPPRPISVMKEFYRSVLLDKRRYAKAIPILTIMTFGLAGFTDFKSMIGLITAYEWDVTFMKLDRAIHFGQDPWRLLFPIFGNEIATIILNFFYHMWFFIMYVFWVSATWTSNDSGWERQFLLSFILVWIIGGTVLAIYWSSMGPVFYDIIDPANNPFQDQVDELYRMNENVEVWALTVQETLRETYFDPQPSKVAGISAMPSMHNATSTLFVFAGFRIWKPLGWAMLAFLICIMIGSVHLAWHYAVDAYAGVLIAIIIWFVSCRLIVWQDRFLEKMGFTGLER